jgi:hypothetical protein
MLPFNATLNATVDSPVNQYEQDNGTEQLATAAHSLVHGFAPTVAILLQPLGHHFGSL